MNKLNRISCFFIIALVITFTSCKKNNLHSTELLPSTESHLKIVYASLYASNPKYFIYINNKRASNLLSSTGATPKLTPFPGGGLNTGGSGTSDYLSVSSGENAIKFIVPTVNLKSDSLTLTTTNIKLEKGKKYTLFLTDTAQNTQTILVEDSIQRPQAGFVTYKFVNLIPDVAAVDLYNGTVKVAENIPYKGISPTFSSSLASNPATAWTVKPTGKTETLATYTSAASIANQRVFTIFTKGYNAYSATKDLRARGVSLIYTE